MASNMVMLYRDDGKGKHCNPHVFFFSKNASENNGAYRIDHNFSATTCNESTSPSSSSKVFDKILHLDYANPTMFKDHQQQMRDKITLVIHGWKAMSYFSYPRLLYWFLELVGNAITENCSLAVETSSSQILRVALCVSSPSNALKPMDVVSAAPFTYSGSPGTTDVLKSGLQKWAGDANTYTSDRDQYIEVITSPNNPDGFIREAVVKPQSSPGTLIHNLSRYHAVFGWLLVKDCEIASTKITQFAMLSATGVSKSVASPSKIDF
ncbi:tryptophan aminotransferase-related protein 2-like [Andrographis paniculata]|uniref:tryptophan aminotransferase-related protein 2-like n=1 Tax=Andrographis paniculata TaxID=175694 RepID=UPI0021E7A5EC|nr:tryptophan aminotransferase-related protein 2-like [Andrographis paniculata]